MGKKSRTRNVPQATGDVGIPPRQPCPCGSGRRYKACHGNPDGPPSLFVARPFAGMAGEMDIIAMREFVPSATAPISVRDSDRAVALCSLLPMAAPALVRQDGTVWLGLQVQHSFGDPSRDLAAVLAKALTSDEGGVVGLTDSPGEGPRLQDLLEDAPLDVTVHDGFDWWVADVDDPTGSVRASLASANAAANPTRRLGSVEGAYWTDVGSKEHLRWVLPHDEDRLLTALARVHAAGRDSIAEGSRLVGMFRAHGVLAPVWDLPIGTGAEALEETAAEFGAHLETALADDSRLGPDERAARNGLANRQLSIR